MLTKSWLKSAKEEDEHSQPVETPIEIPDPSLIEKDVDVLLAWLDEFNKRSLN
jgi:hypothetical protein